MLLNLMWVSLVDPWLWQIIAHIFRNLPGGPTMWLYEDHIACMKKIIQVSTSTYFNFWCKLICIEYIQGRGNDFYSGGARLIRKMRF